MLRTTESYFDSRPGTYREVHHPNVPRRFHTFRFVCCCVVPRPTYLTKLVQRRNSLCRNPFDPKERVVKRLIGVDGDWVRPRGNRHNVLRVPEGCCWVEGDNHGVSEDSNQFGPVSLRG